MKKVVSALFLTLSVSAATISTQLYAESIRVPVGQNSYSGVTPKKGQTKDQVEAQFGSANSTHGPNGNPPIYYWEYDDFTVYFEADHVIHSVIKKR